MNNLELAKRLCEEASSFNIFGSSNVYGEIFQNQVLKKLEDHLMSRKVLFKEREFQILKAIIAQYLVKNEMLPLAKRVQDDDLSFEEKMKNRIIQILKITKVLAKGGSFNCEIANLVIFLLLKNANISTTVEHINMSGIKEHDNKHTFIVLGAPNSQAFSVAFRRIDISTDIRFEDYIVCDAYSNECYKATLALSESDQRLAKYDDIHSEEQAACVRFLYIDNLSLYRDNLEIKRLCDEIIHAKESMEIKERVNKIFQEILFAPFIVRGTQITPELALRRAAFQGNDIYIKELLKEFTMNINSQDNVPGKKFTALHWALKQNKETTVKLLIDHSADITIKSDDGIAPLKLIKEHNNRAIRNLLTI